MPSDHFWTRFSSSLGDRGLRWTGKLNVPVYRLSGGRLMGTVGEAPVLLLITTGRKSGQPRTSPIVYLAHGADLVLIDTNAGNERLPAWAHNLRANPEAEVEVGRQRRRVLARAAEGTEREELWRAHNVQYSGFDEYAAKLRRRPSVWVLEPR
jgi:deazaflavin-dependent oxidoreductase (nitroreductase family)